MNTIRKRAIFLDFDGVLFDTVKEAYCVSIIAQGRAAHISEVDLGSPHFREFCRYRYLIGPAWNYFYLLGSIDEMQGDSKLDPERAFRQAVKNSIPDEYRPFEEEFFRSRRRLRETELECWLSLSAPYGIVDDLRPLLKEQSEKFFMVTTRDRESVLHLLRQYRVDFPEANVLAGEEYAVHNSKRDIIQRLIRDHRIEESVFIDDLEEHLMACKTIENLLPVQARWGYVTPEIKEDNSASVFQGIEKFVQGENVWA